MDRKSTRFSSSKATRVLIPIVLVIFMILLVIIFIIIGASLLGLTPGA